jgi:hypothetical protein
LTPVELDTGTVRATVPAPDDTTAILAAPLAGYSAVLTAAGASAHLMLLGLAGEPAVSGATLATAARGLCRWHSLILLASANTIEAREWDLDEGDIALALPPGPVFVGGYTRAEVDLISAGVGRNDVEFVVEEGPEFGFCSAGIEPPAPTGWARVIVGAGPYPGQYHVACRRLVDGQTLARVRFRVTSHWPDDDIGPGVALTGKQQVFAHGSWGGGPNGPQNVNVLAAPEAWRVLMVLVELRDRSFGANAGGRRAAWADVLVGAKSVQTYYEEMSLFSDAPAPPIPHGTTIRLAADTVLGPIRIDAGWGDAFEPKGKDDIWAGWSPKTTFYQECTNALCDALADQGTGDTILPSCDAGAGLEP